MPATTTGGRATPSRPTAKPGRKYGSSTPRINRARALLRDAGVEPPTRFADELAEARGNVSPEARRKALVWRVRVFLLGIIITLVVLNAAGVLKLY